MPIYILLIIKQNKLKQQYKEYLRMMTESKADMLGADVMLDLREENELMTIDMSLPLQVLFDDFITFISKTDFD